VQSNHSVFNAAVTYLTRGWQPVPVPHGEKNPRLKEWGDLKITRRNVSDYFDGEPQNIGVRLGRASGGLTDVDLDCDEALTLASHFLPKTAAVFGRKPGAHHLYVTDLSETERCPAIKFQEPSALGGHMLLELRIGGSDGSAQTLFPPSWHPRGKPICWDQDGEPAQVDGARLKRSVTWLAIAALLARHYPRQIAQDESARVAGALLARAGIEPGLVRAIAHAAPGQARQHNARETCFGSPAANGRKASVLPRLRDLWGDLIAETVREWLGLAGPRAEP